MYRNLFTAWYCLGVLVLCLLVYLIYIPFIGMYQKGCFAALGLLGFLPFFWFVTFHKQKDDERDVSFRQRAVFHGLIMGVSSFGPINVLVFFAYWSPDSDILSIPAHAFWLPANCSLILTILTFSVTLILLYYKGERALKV